MKLRIGGQAVIEGVMMRSKNYYALSIRRKSGLIETKVDKCLNFTKNKILSFPFIRGIVALIENLILGTKILSYSADVYAMDYDENYKKDKEKKSNKILMFISMLFSLIFGVFLFVILPLWITNFLKKSLNITGFSYNIIDGIFRLIIFLLYVVIISLMKDIRRVFEYHGAEHKAVFVYENNEELNFENSKKYSTLHPRCGTNFMFIVVMVSILVISVFRVDSFFMKFFIRILLLPFIAGISFEILRFLGNNFDKKFFRIFFYPGLCLQKLTTREPDEKELEVAFSAIKATLEAEEKFEQESKKKE